MRTASVLLLLLAVASPLAGALLLTGAPLRAPSARNRFVGVRAGFFDNLFQESEEEKRRKDEAFAAQQEIMRRRRDPDLMDEYKQQVVERRLGEANTDRELTELQRSGGGGDKLEAWKEMRAEGKVKSMDSTERDADTAILGSSDGLIGERMDTKLPYVDEGWVDEGRQVPAAKLDIELPSLPEMPDVMGAFNKLFGGGDDKRE